MSRVNEGEGCANIVCRFPLGPHSHAVAHALGTKWRRASSGGSETRSAERKGEWLKRKMTALIWLGAMRAGERGAVINMRTGSATTD